MPGMTYVSGRLAQKSDAVASTPQVLNQSCAALTRIQSTPVGTVVCSTYSFRPAGQGLSGGTADSSSRATLIAGTPPRSMIVAAAVSASGSNSVCQRDSSRVARFTRYVPRAKVTCSARRHFAVLKLELDARLKELRDAAADTEAIQGAIAVGELETHVVGQKPVGHRRHPPELPALNVPAVEVDVREVRDQFPASRPARKHLTQRRDLVEESAASVVRADLAGGQPGDYGVPTVEERVARLRRVHALEEIFAADEQRPGPIVGLESHHLRAVGWKLPGVDEVRRLKRLRTRSELQLSVLDLAVPQAHTKVQHGVFVLFRHPGEAADDLTLVCGERLSLREPIAEESEVPQDVFLLDITQPLDAVRKDGNSRIA